MTWKIRGKVFIFSREVCLRGFSFFLNCCRYFKVSIDTEVSDTHFGFFVDSCSKITMIGKPVTHNSNYKTQGAWMKDPLGIMGTETIFVMAGYSGRNVVEEFENMGMFKAGVTRKTYSLPYQWDGT